MRGAIVVFVVVAGCGRIGFDASPTDAAPDAAPDAPDAALVFATPVPIPNINTSQLDDDPSLTADLLELYFSSDRIGSLGEDDIWVATRASIADAWSTPVNVTDLSSGAREATPDVSPDGLTLYFSSGRAGGPGGLDVWRSTRSSRAAPWAPPVLVTELSSSSNDFAAATDAAGLVIVLSSDRASALGGHDLYEARRSTTAEPFSTPQPITELNTNTLREAESFLSPDALVLCYATQRATYDMLCAERATTSSPFGAPVEFPELEMGDELDPWLSADRRYLVFSRNGDILETRR